MRYLPAWFEDLAPEQLHAHIRYLGTELGDRSWIEIELGSSGVVVPASKRVYKRKSPTVTLLLRTSSVGRQPLERMFETLSGESYEIRVRRSAKKKFLSQCKVVLSSGDPTYPLKAVSILRTISCHLDIEWPPNFAVGYIDQEVANGLPGKYRHNSLAWRAGYAIGRTVGEILPKS